ncbi:hypothetical protein [Ottowia sp.]|uniref:hypothetical protein n=1 Tax=Ottowia sp. TaxID=1898956 RepID=UPI0025D4EEDC|nr:hypothetical protein [Ottowia sp.]MBK6616254.1 EAL domain-containing protein [Ottowia sp.]
MKLLAEQPWKAGALGSAQEPGTYSIDKLRPAADAMRSLHAAVELLAGRKGCPRAVITVEAQALLSFDERFIGALGTIPRSLRERLVVEIDVRGVEICCDLADMARVIQEESGPTVAVLTPCDELDRIEELVGAMEPGILTIDGNCIRQCLESGSRIALLDAVEIGVQNGALTMAAEVDTPDALATLKDIGFDLLYGRAVSNVRSLVAGDFSGNVHMMSRLDRRQRGAVANA